MIGSKGLSCSLAFMLVEVPAPPDLVDGELVVQGTATDPDAGRDDRLGDLVVEGAESLIGFCGGLFHRGEGDHEVLCREMGTADGRVLQRARCVCTP